MAPCQTLRQAPGRSIAPLASLSASSRRTKSSRCRVLWRTRRCRNRRQLRVLRALERNGLAQRQVGGGFRPGPVLVEYARRDASVGDLATLAWAFLVELGRATGETANIAIPTPAGVARIAQVDSDHPLGAGNWVGRRIPPHASALGKVFMALGASQPPFGRLAELGPATITTMAELLQELGRVKAAGYATSWEELGPACARPRRPCAAHGERSLPPSRPRRPRRVRHESASPSSRHRLSRSPTS